MTAPRPVVIVGTGLAGTEVAQALVAGGVQRPVVMIGEERHPPYDRPPLSKAVLAGSATAASASLWPNGCPAEVSLHLGMRTVAIDRASRTVALDDGTSVPYERLVLATGGRPRILDVAGGSNALTLRTIDDSRAIGHLLTRARSLVVIGGGFIGLEVASTARSLGVDVAVVESAPQLCQRVLPPPVADALLALHASHGVTLRLSARTRRIERAGAQYLVQLDDGQVLPADLVVAGVGMQPNVALAADAGLAVDDGVLVDARGRTSDEDIFAAGDVAREGGRHRLESWASARDQARRVAAALLGVPAPQREPPWFWSDQFDLNLQMLGAPPLREPTAIRGSLADRRGTAFWLDAEDKIEAVASLNTPRDIAVARRLWARGIRLSREQLADESLRLDALLKTAAAA